MLGVNRTAKSIFSNFIFKRRLHTTKVLFIDPKSVTEVEFPVPWGHIAGKWWGKKQFQPILAIHGGLDNANSYDKLLPLLDAPSVLCIDLPGHGQSSHLPPGISISYLDCLLHLRYLVKNYFKWERIALMGHSLGSTFCFAYAGLYPTEVSWMINLDCGRFSIGHKLSQLVGDTRLCYSIADDPPASSKCYTWEEVVKYTYAGRQQWGFPLTFDSCETLAQRSVKKVGDNSYMFTLDSRLKYMILHLPTPEMWLALAKQIRSASLGIFPNGGLQSLPDSTPRFLSINPETLELHEKEMRKKSEVISVTVGGPHHVHLEQPENIYNIINEFIKTRSLTS